MMNGLLNVKLVLVLLISMNFSVNSQNIYYAVSQGDDTLRKIDIDTRTVLSAIQITVPGQVVQKSNGLAQDPTTGVVYAIVQLNGITGRDLISLDTITGVGTLIGNTGDTFAGISFNNAGVLYAVTGDGAATPETLYTLDLSTGASTMVMTLGNGNDGEVIAFNSDTDVMYHGSGNGTTIFESVTLPTSTDSIALSGDVYTELTAMLYAGGGKFIVASFSLFYTIDTSGVVALLDSIPFDFSTKGLIRANSPAGINQIEASVVELVYPNPADDVVYFENSNLIGEQFTLIAVNGKVIKTGVLHQELNVSMLETGMYLLKLDRLPNIQMRIIKR